MKQQHSLQLVIVLLMAVATRLVAAPLTANWPFTTPSQYAVSNSNKIEVAQGVARLISQKSSLETSGRSDYLTNAVQLTNVVFGQNSSIGLALSNGLYASSGVYTSRVFNGGEGNVWNGLAMRLSNRGLVPNLSSPVKLLDSGIINDPAALALYHFDGTWMDEVTSTMGTPFSSPQYTNDAFFGSQALRLNGSNYFQTVGSTLLNNRSSGSFVLWMKLLSRNGVGGILSDRSSGFTGLGQLGTKVSFDVNGNEVISMSDIPLTNWCFIVGTFNAGIMKLYFNGNLERSGACVATLTQASPFLLGWNTYSGAWKTDGLFDEVAVYGRELSAGEIQNLYTLSGPFGVRLRSGATTNLAGNFSGPTASAGSYYVDNLTPLQIAGNFNPAHQYLQYEASFYNTQDQLQAPYLESLRFMGSAGEFVDDVWGDFVQGTGSVGSANFPTRSDAPFVALGQVGNVVVSNGLFSSRVFDGGAAVNWSRLAWDRGVALSPPILGLEGLWHMDVMAFGVWSGSWADSSGKGHNGSNSGAGFTPYSKVGAYAAIFNGVNASFNVGSLGAAVQTVEFWMNAELPTMPILELGGSNAWLAVSNNFVTVNGWNGANPSIYVNGGLRSQLLPGWNHVAVVFPSSVNAYNVTVGAARGGYFTGKLDELAVYNRALTTGEIATDCSAGRRDAAGQIRFRARADNVNPLTTDFVGKDGTASDYFLDPAGSTDLPVSFLSKRYFQYQAILDGEGTVSPALRSVTVTYGGGKTTGDVAKVDFVAGDFSNATTRLVGNEIMLRPLFSSGPANLAISDSPSLLGLWHMDDPGWVSGGISVMDSSGSGRHATPQGNASVQQTKPAVGMKNGVFGSTGYLSIPAATLSANDFTISGWFKTTANTRAPLFSSYDVPGQPYFSLELNWDGTLTKTGQAVFVVSDGSSLSPVLGCTKGLNDGAWHHISGVRNGAQSLLYIDGVLAGSAPLGIGSVGSGALTMAKNGNQTPSAFYSGSLDEFALHGRALTEAEIGDLAASGFMTLRQGMVEGPVLGIGQRVYWKTISWGCDAPYGRALKPESTMAGLWHLDSITNGTTTEDASANANYGNISAGVTVNASGRFGGALNIGPGQSLQIPDTATLRVDAFSMETWVYASNTVSLVVAQKQNGGTGFVLGTDATGRPTLTVNGITCTDFDVLRARKWNLLCGTYDGVTARLYVNGFLKATAAVSGSAATSVPLNLGGTLNGKLDEAVLYGRAINSREALDHYRAGVCSLKFQVRTWSPGAQGGYVGPDGTANTFFTDYDGSALTTNAAPTAELFQAKAILGSEDARFTPKLDSVRVDMEGYPTDNPWVAPADGYGSPFDGNLTSFSQTLATTNTMAVQYQISGNNGTNWYAWIGGTWQDVTIFTNSATQWAMSTPAPVINANIDSFYNQYYQGIGGIFKFRAFLQSDAIQQVALDQVNLGYSNGRLMITSPNGTEVSNNAWVVGVPYNITWQSVGTVTATNIVIELYDQSGARFVRTIASGVTNSGVYRSIIRSGSGSEAGANYRILIRDASDPSIYDWSDSDFELIYNLHLSIPNGGEKWYVGETNGVSWESPLGTEMWLWLSNDNGSNNWVQVASATAVSGTNFLSWAIQTHEALLPSMTAKMAVSTPDASPLVAAFRDLSDQSFIMAGAVVTYPNASTGAKMGDVATVQWTSAAAGPNVKIELFDGSGWSVISNSVPNVNGTNGFACLLNAPNPTEAALIRISSLSDGRIVAISEPFLLADVRILSPKGGASRDSWLIGTTNYVSWVSGGAGNLVNVDYSVDGLIWQSLAANYLNTNSTSGMIITNYSPAWIIQGPPSSSAVVRVSSVDRPDLQAKAGPFDFSGVQVTFPNGGEYWEFAGTNLIRWLHQAAGFNIGIGITYNGGATTNDYVTLDPSVFNSSPRTVIPGRLLRPSTLAKVRLVANDTLGNAIPMTDVSDAYFNIRGLSMFMPSNNLVYTMGTIVTNGLQWYSAATEDTKADLYYAQNGSNFTSLIVGNTDNLDAGSSWNHINWAVSRSLDPSLTARVKVLAGSYQAVSPVFTLRGIRVTQPAAGQVFDIGSSQSVKWLKAGLNDNAYISNVVSVAGLAGPYVAGGLPVNAYVLPRSFLWNIAPDLDPTTNAVIKMMVTTTEDSDIIMYSDPFTLRGAKIISPTTGTNWMVGTQRTIVYSAAGLANGAVGNIYYSADGGGTFDMTHPVAINVTMSSGINSVLWDIENSSTLTRQPSTNAVLKLISGTLTNISKSFRMGGIKVTSPKGTDIWAVSDLTNIVQWVGVDTQPSFSLFYTVYDAPQHSATIASGVPGFSYNWAMTSNAIGSQVTVTVTDGVATNESPKFVIVPSPSIRLVSPVAGDFWKVGETNNVIRWAQGGNMSNNFTIGYSPYPFTVTNTIAVGAFPSANSIYSYNWGSIPNALGQVRLVVINNDMANIMDSLDDFRIAAAFDISPFVGELHALEPKDLNWITYGSVSGVDFYYSTDPFRGTNSWTLINTAGPFTAVAHAQPSSYLWSLPNIKSSTVWIRIQDHDYFGSRFDASRKGPYDDLGTFEVLYYTVVWRLFDAATSNELDVLNVTDSSGWSGSSLASPTSHDYPYGFWNTVWFKQYFNDKIVLNWSSKTVSTNAVYMTRTEAAPEYHVMANFVYDPSNSVFKTVAWLERSSRIIPDPTECKIYIYDPNGNEVQVANAGAPRSTGVFWADVGALLDKNIPYFAKVEIKYSGVIYTSGITFTLLTPAESAVAAINAARDAIMGNVSNVNDNVTGVGLAQQAFREDVTNRLASLSNSTAQISMDTSGIQSNLLAFSSNAMTQLSSLTNTIGVIGPGGTNLLQQVGSLVTELDKRTARILSRPSSVKLGSTFTVLYRSQPLSAPTITVTDSTGAPQISVAMIELSGGVFEKSLTASWGLGDFMVECRDLTGAADRMIIKVTALELDDMAGTLVGVSNRLAGVELSMSTMSVAVSNVQTTVNGTANNVTNLLANVVTMESMMVGLTNMPGQMNYLTNVIDKVAGLTNINSAVSTLTNAVGQILVLTNMSAQISQLSTLTNLTPQMTSLSNSMVKLMGITNQINTLSAQMNYVTNVIDQIVVLTNINASVAAMTGAVAQITVLTNMSGQLNYMTNVIAQIGVLTNLTPQMSSLSNSMVKLLLITNQMNTMSAQMNYLTNVIDQVTALTNINPAVTAMTNAVAQISSLTNMSGQLNYMTNVLAQMGGVTNLIPQVSSLTNSMARLSGITNQLNAMSGQLNYLTNVIDQIVVLTNINASVAAMTGAVAQISGLTNMGSQLNYLTNAMFQIQGLTNLTPQMASVTNLLGRMASLTNLTPQVASLTNMPLLLASLTNMPTQLAGISNVMGQVAGLTNLPAQMADVTNIVGKLAGITNLSDQVAIMTNAIGQIAGLTNLPSQMADVTNIVGKLAGITNLSDQVAVMTNAIGQIAGLTNLPAQMSDVTNIVGRLTGITNLSDQVAAMTNSISQIAGLTNMGSRLDFLTNTVGQLGSLTNLSGQMATLTNLPDQVAYLTNAVTQLSGLTNLTAQVAGMTNSINQLSGLTNLPAQMSDLATAVGLLGGLSNQMNGVITAINQLGSLTNLGPQVTQLMAAIDQITALTNMSAQVNDLSTSMGRLIGITNMETQVSQLTGTVASVATAVNLLSGQLGSLTNLGTQVNQLEASIAQIAALTNMSGQVNGLVSAVAQLGSVTNLGAQIAQVAATVDTIVSLTNLNTRMDNVTTAINQLGSLTNLGATADQLSASIAQITALTNMSGQVNGLVTGLASLQSATLSISNIVVSISSASSSFQTASNALSAVAALTPAMASVSQTVSNIQSTMRWDQVTAMQTSLTNLVGGLGSASDAAGSLTLFGYLAEVEKNLNAVGATAQQAASRASGARSQANSAAGVAQRIMQNMASAGQMSTVVADVGVIRKALEDALTNINAIPGTLTTAEMVKTVKGAQDIMLKLSEGRVAPGGDGAKGEPGAWSDPKAVESLINQLSETKAMMQATRQLMDEAVNKPVVVDWLEGSK